MPRVFPFRAVEFAGARDVSLLIAPPYDVLDAPGKQRLLARDARNIVGVDLPHTPAKELGPAGVYEDAGGRYRGMLLDGTLRETERPVMFAYRQTWEQAEAGEESKKRTISRTGLACCVETVPFGARAGGGILAHEETFSGPKEDRLALMRATRAQLSPIFGLHADERGAARDVLARVMGSRAADRTARTEDGTLHEVWTIGDAETIGACEAALAGEDIFVADGHHRYNTALNYLHELESRGSVPSDHPARRTMCVIVGMSDPGLVIWPTHRVLGGMKDYTFEKFLEAAASFVRVEPVADLRSLERAVNAGRDERVFGMWDCKTGKAGLARPASDDLLRTRFPDKPRVWRELTVAFCQYVIVEQVCEPRLNGGRPIRWAFPHTIDEVEAIARGAETGAGGGSDFAQIAIIVRPTLLSAVRDISRAGVLMPQKSTFFYPKLATGLFIHSLESGERR